MKDKKTKQVLISMRLGEALHIASIKAGKSMREFLDDLIEKALSEDDVMMEDAPEDVREAKPPAPSFETPSNDIGAISIRVSSSEEMEGGSGDRSERDF